jgi:phosphoglycerol transferase MdoB-like AlkP superfamily enzyme
VVGAVCPLLFALLALAGLPGRTAAETPDLAWELVSARPVRVYWVGLPVKMRVRVRNTGRLGWSEAAGDHLSYHWLSLDGRVVTFDGARTRFPSPVPAGGTADVTARVLGPPDMGRWVLEWEMVREGVRWYGPPAGGLPNRVEVFSLRRSAALQLGFLVLTAVLVVGLRLWNGGAVRDAVVELVPVAWVWAGVVLLCLTFSELADQPLWRGATSLTATGAALFALPVAVTQGRGRRWLASGLLSLLSLLAVADLVYMRYFGNVIPLVAVLGAHQLGQVEGSIVALLHGSDAWLLPAVLAGLVLVLGLPVPRERGERRRRVTLTLGAAVACVVGFVPAGRALARAFHDPSTSKQVFSQQALVGQWGLTNLHVLNAIRTVRDTLERGPLPAGEQARVVQLFRSHADAAPRSGRGFGVARGANLLLIQVESLQQWVVGAEVLGKPVMPTLAGLRERGLYFSGVFDQTGEGRSSDGEFAALNSLHPLPEGAVAFRCSHDHFRALASILRSAGYATLSAHPFERGFWNRAILHPAYGFSRSLFRRELGPGDTIGWGLADGAFFERMEPELAHLSRPFFAFLITLGLHHPFKDFPDRHKDLEVGALRDTPLGNYLEAMHYFDESFAGLLGALRANGLLDDTVVALYGDHEAGFAIDQDIVDLAAMGPWDPSYNLRIRRVPFFVLLPHRPIAGEVPVVGGHIDIAPTLLYLLGQPRPVNFLGSVLYPGRDAVAAMWDGSVVAADRVYVSTGPRIGPGGECFAYPTPQPLPLESCSGIIARGEDELDASQQVLEHDLVPVLVSALR